MADRLRTRSLHRQEETRTLKSAGCGTQSEKPKSKAKSGCATGGGSLLVINWLWIFIG